MPAYRVLSTIDTSPHTVVATHVNPVERLIPARKAATSSASKPRWKSFPNIRAVNLASGMRVVWADGGIVQALKLAGAAPRHQHGGRGNVI